MLLRISEPYDMHKCVYKVSIFSVKIKNFSELHYFDNYVTCKFQNYIKFMSICNFIVALEKIFPLKI